jgi:Mn-dependent DtxR family transcriptional regulator
VDVLQLDSEEANKIACHAEHALSAKALARLVQVHGFLDKARQGARWSADKGFLDDFLNKNER